MEFMILSTSSFFGIKHTSLEHFPGEDRKPELYLVKPGCISSEVRKTGF